MSFQINPVKETPYEDAKMLGHKQIVRNLKTFLENENMITPLSIAIHGDWGSGKTSIMKTLEKTLDSTKFETLFFEAWKYEYSNPALGLITEIAEKYSTGDTARNIVRAGVYILSQKYFGVDPEKIMQIIRASKAHSETLSEQLKSIVQEKIGDKTLIVIIDDLDRCDVENSLQLLAILKLFFDLENCICIAAVDFERLKQAWRQKHKIIDNENEDGSNYLEKIFQIRIGIPKPTSIQIKEYIVTLTSDMPDYVADLFSETLPKNPRSIKRILNLVSYRKNLLTRSSGELSSIFWTLLEETISNKMIIQLNDALVKQGSSITHLMTIGDQWKDIKDLIERTVGNNIINRHADKLSAYFVLCKKILDEQQTPLVEVSDDFKILYASTNEVLR